MPHVPETKATADTADTRPAPVRVPPPAGGCAARSATVQPKLPAPRVPPPAGGRVGPGAAVQPKLAAPASPPRVPPPAGGGAHRAAVQPKLAAPASPRVPPPAGAPRGGVVQRLQLIAVANGQARESDFTVLNNVNFARAINRAKGVQREMVGSIANQYSSANVDYAKGEIVYVHGHGSEGLFEHPVRGGDLKFDQKGSINGLSYSYAASTIISKLSRGYNGEFLHIVVLSCKGAKPGADWANEMAQKTLHGFVEELSQQMTRRGMRGKVEAHETSVMSYRPFTSTFRAASAAADFEQYTKKADDAGKEAFATWLAAHPNATYGERLAEIKQYEAGIAAGIARAVAAGVLVRSTPKVQVIGAAGAGDGKQAAAGAGDVKGAAAAAPAAAAASAAK